VVGAKDTTPMSPLSSFPQAIVRASHDQPKIGKREAEFEARRGKWRGTKGRYLKCDYDKSAEN
jgi:hypothetical protein